MIDDGLPDDWTPARNRLEFIKWLEILYGLIKSGPTDWGTWQQTRDFQEILARLARRLGFDRGPIERRKETITLTTTEGRELHEREYVIATDPFELSAAERFDGWITYLDAEPIRSHGARGGLSETQFRRQVLTRLKRWQKAAANCAAPSSREPQNCGVKARTIMSVLWRWLR